MLLLYPDTHNFQFVCFRQVIQRLLGMARHL
jgi:hypothetical protein